MPTGMWGLRETPSLLSILIRARSPHKSHRRTSITFWRVKASRLAAPTLIPTLRAIRRCRCWRSAEKFYNALGLAEVLANAPRANMRGTETSLISALQLGQIDYLAIYRSDALQHHLKFLELHERPK